MGKLTDLKRELRAFYKPKARGIGEASGHNTGSGLELESRASTPSRPSTAGGDSCSNVETSVPGRFPHYVDQAPAVKSSENGPHPDTTQAIPTDEETRPSDEHKRERVTQEKVPQDGSPNMEASLKDASLPSSPSMPEPRQGTSEDVTTNVDLPVSADPSIMEGLEENAEATETAEADPLTFEEAQAIRNAAYITFSGEDEEDYTQGLPRFVIASDGVQNCGAILMTLDFSARIQKAIQKQRHFDKAQSLSIKQKWALTRLESKVQSAIASCRTRLVRSEGEGEAGNEEQRSLLEQRFAVLEAMLVDVRGRKQEIAAGVETQADILREVQAAVIAYLEDIFICGMLIEPDEEETTPVVDKLDLEEEYLIFCEKLKATNDPLVEDGEVVTLDNSKDHLKAEPLSEEDQKKQDRINEVWAAKQAMLQARNAFDNRAAQQAQEFQANLEAANNNQATADDSPEAFDIRWVKQTQELTRAVINAEAAYAEVKRHALDEGVPIELDLDDQLSGYVDPDEDDCGGYRMSVEQEMVTSVSSPTMRKWLSAVPEGFQTESPVTASREDADEWEAEEVGISDSVSLVADGKERARIDRWRKACSAEKQE